MPSLKLQKEIEKLAKQARDASYKLATASLEQRNKALVEIASLLDKNRAQILEENKNLEFTSIYGTKSIANIFNVKRGHVENVVSREGRGRRGWAECSGELLGLSVGLSGGLLKLYFMCAAY